MGFHFVRAGAVLGVAALLVASAKPACGITYLLEDGAGSAIFDADTGTITNWTLDSKQHVGPNGLSYFYRMAGDASESPLASAATLDPNGIDYVLADPTFLTARYTIANRFKDTYSIFFVAAGTNTSHLDFNVRVDSLLSGSNQQDLSIFAFNDFDLAGQPSDPLDDNVTISPVNKHNNAFQTDSLTTLDDIINSGNGGGDANLGPTLWQASTSAALFSSLTDGAQTTLNNNDSASNDDLAYAFQYNLRLRGTDAPPDSQSEVIFTILDGKTLNQPFEPGQAVPEPLTTMLGVLGITALGLGATARRRGALQ